MSKRVVLLRCALLSTVAVINSACSSIDRLKAIGEQPPLSAMDNPTTKPGYKPVQMPMPTPQPATYNPNSLWRNGSRGFFKDQRAHQVGDILTVKGNINDTPQFENETQRSRSTTEDSAITNFIGANTIANPAKAVLPGSLLTPNGDSSTDGQEESTLNFEIRELVVAGVVRPEDIDSDNTIDLPKIAEARIAYGGRGTLSNIQEPRYGQQALDVLLPF